MPFLSTSMCTDLCRDNSDIGVVLQVVSKSLWWEIIPQWPEKHVNAGTSPIFSKLLIHFWSTRLKIKFGSKMLVESHGKFIALFPRNGTYACLPGNSDSHQNFAQRLLMASYIGSIFLSSYIWLPPGQFYFCGQWSISISMTRQQSYLYKCSPTCTLHK